MSLHRCTETECPFIGQTTSRSCLCHKTDEQVLAERVKDLTIALEFTTKTLEEFLAFHDSKTKPCGEYGVECPISMGEWFGNSERAGIKAARAALVQS